jgi:hypothetical protein
MVGCADSKRDQKNKKYLIIPAAGRSSRFSTNKPKWLLTHPHGQLMIEEVVSGLDTKLYDECHIVILKEHCEKYDADVILKQCFGDLFKITILESPTKSSPETVVQCILKNNLEGQIIIKDCDCFVSYEEPKNENFVIGLNIYNQEVKNLIEKSFIQTDESFILKNLIEKKVVSDTICVGVYSLNSKILVSLFNELNSFSNQEIYFSHLISLALEKNNIFTVGSATKYIDWGTSKEWFEYTSNLKTYIFDIDGIFLENTGKYGKKNWENYFSPIEDNVMALKKLSENGSEIIFITSRTEKYLEYFKKYLNEMGIKYKSIISGCNHNKRIIVNDFSSTNPYPSCLSINIPRNGNLNDYL